MALWQKLWQCCQNCLVSIYWIIFRRNIFSETFSFFFRFRTLCGRIWVFCLKISARVSKLRSTVPRGLFEEKMFCRLKILFLNTFWHYKKHRFHGRIFLAMLSKLHCSGLREHFEEKRLFWNCFNFFSI